MSFAYSVGMGMGAGVVTAIGSTVAAMIKQGKTVAFVGDAVSVCSDLLNKVGIDTLAKDCVEAISGTAPGFTGSVALSRLHLLLHDFLSTSHEYQPYIFTATAVASAVVTLVTAYIANRAPDMAPVGARRMLKFK